MFGRIDQPNIDTLPPDPEDWIPVRSTGTGAMRMVKGELKIQIPIYHPDSKKQGTIYVEPEIYEEAYEYLRPLRPPFVFEPTTKSTYMVRKSHVVWNT